MSNKKFEKVVKQMVVIPEKGDYMIGNGSFILILAKGGVCRSGYILILETYFPDERGQNKKLQYIFDQ